MKKFDNAKSEYLKIQASEALNEKVNDILKNKKSNNIFARVLSVAACFVIVGVVVLNAVPYIAYAVKDAGIIGKIVNAVTFTVYEHNENGFNAKVVTPKIEGMLDKELEEKLNNEFEEYSAYIISAYENDVKEMKKEFGDKNVHVGVTSSYQIKTNNDNILALDVYVVNEVGSSSTKHTYYNLNKKTGELLTLNSLFKENANYINPISEYIKNEMKRRNNEENCAYWIEGEENSFDGFSQIEKNQKFYINNDGNIVICFDKYEVAPGAYGSSEFVIPNEIVKDIVK